MEPILWMVLGVTTLGASLFAHRSARARQIGRLALGALFVLAGALINAWYLLTDVDYGGFADASYIPFVRDAWQSVVAPNQFLFIGLLVVFEAAVGALVVMGGRRTRIALVAMMGFHVALLSFGWFFYAWSLPMLIALGLLLRAEVSAATTGVDEHTAMNHGGVGLEQGPRDDRTSDPHIESRQDLRVDAGA